MNDFIETKPTNKKKWICGREYIFVEKENGDDYWQFTGKHTCSFVEDNSMGEKNKGRCITCGERDGK